jgi:hypothetical protein
VDVAEKGNIKSVHFFAISIVEFCLGCTRNDKQLVARDGIFEVIYLDARNQIGNASEKIIGKIGGQKEGLDFSDIYDISDVERRF